MSTEEERTRATPARVRRKLAAILHADVQGYSRLIGDDEVATLQVLTPFLAMMRPLVQQHDGRVAGAAGDSLLAEFPSAVAAVQCAVEMQHEMQKRNAELSVARRVEFRMGINLGEIVVEGEQIHGDGINIAVRLEGLADAGGICLSEVIYQQIKNKLALEYEDMGEHVLKNIAELVRAYRIKIAPRGPTPGSSQQAPTLELPDKPSIAVLPFVNLSSDPEQEYFSDGITEDLITDLSKLSGLFVTARNSVFTYKGKVVKVEEVSRELGVRYVLEGSVRRAGDRVRITAQLVDALRGHHLWAERYDRPLRDLFALQDEIIEEIVAKLGAKIWQAELARVRQVPTDNFTAYDYYLRGWEYRNRLTQEANTQARQQWEQAIELDPRYAEAYAALGWTYHLEWIWQWSRDPQTLEQALALGQQALALDNCLSEAHRLLSEVYLWKRQYEQTGAAGEQAIACSPNEAVGYFTLAEILNMMGRPEEAIRLAEKAIRFDPHYREAYLYEVGLAYSLMKRYEEAIITLTRVLACYPNHVGAHLTLAVIYWKVCREEEARAEAAEVLRINPNFSLEEWRQAVPGRDPAALERFINLLSKAGLK